MWSTGNNADGQRLEELGKVKGKPQWRRGQPAVQLNMRKSENLRMAGRQ